MAAPKGNQFWKQRSSHGAKPIFSDPKKLLQACTEYFEWTENNPLKKQITYQGAVTGEEDLIRAMTIAGLCIYLDISHDTWETYRTKKDLNVVTSAVDSIIYQQKFTGAAAGLLNPNIIARDLGLSDKAETKHSGTVGFKDVTDMEEEDVDKEISGLLDE